MAARDNAGLTKAQQQLITLQWDLQCSQHALEEDKCLLQVLECLISQQEQLQHVLEKHYRKAQQHTGYLLGEGTPCNLQFADQQQQQQHLGAPPATLCSGLLSAQQRYCSALTSSSVFEDETALAPAAGNSSSYVLGLLASATPGAVQRAASLTVSDLQDWHVHVFQNIMPLLELAKRHEHLSGAEQCSGPYDAAAAADDNAMRAAQPGAEDSDIHVKQRQTRGSSSRHSEQPDSSAGTPALVNAAESEPYSSTAAGLAGQASGGGFDANLLAVEGAEQQLDHCVDAAVRSLALLMLHTPLATYSAAATNMVTREQAAAAPQHWSMVARRLALSPQQQQQMRSAMRAYARMSRAAADEGSRVLQGVTSLSISRVLETSSSSSSSDCRPRSVSVAMGSAAAVPQDSCDAAAAAAVAGHTSTGSAATSAQSAAQAAGGAAAAAAVREDTLSSGDGVTQIAAINSQLQRHMRLRNIQTVCVTIFLLGGLSKLQIAEAIVASFPYYPSMLAIAEAVGAEQQRRQQEQQRCQQELQLQGEQQHRQQKRGGRRNRRKV